MESFFKNLRLLNIRETSLKKKIYKLVWMNVGIWATTTRYTFFCNCKMDGLSCISTCFPVLLQTLRVFRKGFQYLLSKRIFISQNQALYLVIKFTPWSNSMFVFYFVHWIGIPIEGECCNVWLWMHFVWTERILQQPQTL